MAELKDKLEIQISLANRIIGFLRAAQKTAKDKRTVGWCKTQLETLEVQWKLFFQEDLIYSVHKEEFKEHEYFAENVYEEVLTQYTLAKTFFLNAIQPGRNQSSSATDEAGELQLTAPIYKNPLPPIQLPKFSGKKDDWEYYKGMFIALVHDVPSIPPILKIQYLAGSLEGEAKTHLPSPPLTGDKYDGAWKAINDRYDSKKYLLSTHLSKLISCPKVKKRSLVELNRIIDTMRVSKQSIDNLEISADKMGELWLIYHITHKLDFRTVIDWETEVDKMKDHPTYDQFLKFLESQIRILEAAHNTFEDRDEELKSKFDSPKNKTVSTHQSQVSNGCIQCHGSHYLHACPKFKELPLTQRLDFCTENKLCRNCLRAGHFTKKCRNAKRCFTCKGKHHTLIHDNAKCKSVSQPNDDTSSSQEETIEVVTAHATPTNSTKISSSSKLSLLGTALVTLADSYGNKIKVRALIDPGSEKSFISERVLIKLSPKIKKVNVSVTGVGAEVTSTVHKEATIFICSELTKEFRSCISAYVLNKLTKMIPQEEINYKDWKHVKGLTLADPYFYKPQRVDCLRGADVYSAIMLPGLLKGSPQEPLAQQTVFGWILTGSVASKSEKSKEIVRSHHMSIDTSLDILLKKFWEVQELPRKKHLTEEEQQCEDYFNKTVTRDEEGRYVVRLPFKEEPLFVGSREIAASCFYRTEKKLKRNQQLSLKYKDYIHDYLQQNHMELVPKSQLPQSSYYIPHQDVPRSEKTDENDKIRLVFNASKKDKRGKSLNNVSHKGQKLQKAIPIIMIRWKFLKHVYTTDIKQMFRQIVVHEADRDWQRIVWRDSNDQPLQDLRITRVVQGTTSAPFLALRVLKQLAIDERDNFPDGAVLLDHQAYIDDIFGGADNLEDTIQQRDQLIGILRSAGMSLGKWAANSKEILQGVSTSGEIEVDVCSDEAVSALGIKWLPRSDKFIMQFRRTTGINGWTKRRILSTIASFFDPVGWIAPVITTAKIVLQDLWLSNYDWDQPLDKKFIERWATFYTSLENLKKISIPRWVGFSCQEEWHLHGFADASKRMYAAVIYAVKPGVGAQILISKTKLASTTVQTLPRLELSAAELLVKLTRDIVSELPRHPDEIFFWSDSKVVLDWLQGHPSRWPTFVSNRVSTITSFFPKANWRHVKSADNAADCATRGLSPSHLAEHRLWWQGPEWITESPEHWPTSNKKSTEKPTENIQIFLAREVEKKQENHIINILQQHSNFEKIQRIMAYSARFKINCALTTKNLLTQVFSAEEWTTALRYIFRVVQSSHYSREILALERKKPIYKRSNLSSLTPFLDENGLLRVGGRLDNAELSFEERHPIILPGNDSLIERYVKRVHGELLHGGPQLLLSHLYRSVWITQASRLVKKITRSCVKCTRYAANTGTQQMASLPADRVTPQRPFAVTGLDYAGPIKMLFSKGRGAKSVKGYVAIFVCFATRAIHVEIVSDLTTDAFISAYDRFASRRGVGRKLYSDNASTFKGAATELSRLYEESSEFTKKLKGELAIRSCEWEFIPARAPHFGGLWEAAVKSFKTHFVRVVGDSTFTYEELSTLAARIEACLNSRPLCPLQQNPTIPAALTPGHFLSGTPTLSPPQAIEPDERISLTNRWRQLTQLRNSFWIRWRSEVLHHMQRRNKWRRPETNLKVNDIVILKDELTPPATWPLGIVAEVHPGKDNLVRAVTVRTSKSSFVRPVVKLIKLHQEDDVRLSEDSIQDD